jgi:glycosyltransferase involved in cell wall biosynthesis
MNDEEGVVRHLRDRQLGQRALRKGRNAIVVLVSSYDAIGGAEQQAHLFASTLAQRGIHVVVITRKLRGTPLRTCVPGVTVRRVRVFGGPMMCAIHYVLACALAAIGWKLRGRRPSAIYAFEANSPLIAGYLMSTVLSSQLVARVAGSEWSRVPESRLHRLAATHAKYVWILDPGLREEVARWVGEARVAVLSNGVDADLFSPAKSVAEKAQLRRTLSVPVPGRVFVYVGRLETVKGVDLLLRAWSATALEGSDTLIVVGSGELEHSLAAAIPPSAVMLGPKSSAEVAKILRACDVFVLPSHWEGMSNALLEAMASGLAVLATSVGAASTVFDKGSIGRLVEPGSVDALASGLRFFLDLPAAQLAMMGREARRIVAENYSIEEAIDRHLVLVGLAPQRRRSSTEKGVPVSPI